jgi:TRAP-type mannitol/chloroaromatic compound transport system permease small subunit
MDTLIIIKICAEIIFLILFILLLVYLLPAIKKASASIGNIEQKTNEIYNEAVPVIRDLKVVASDLSQLTGKTKVQYNKLESAITNISEAADAAGSLIKSLTAGTAKQVSDSINMISAIFKGVRTFTNKITN